MFRSLGYEDQRQDGHSRTNTALRLPRQATTAEFCVIDFIAQHDP